MTANPPLQQVVVAAPAPVVVAPQQPVRSYALHIFLACFVTCCCGCVLGIVAFVFAGKSNRHHHDLNAEIKSLQIVIRKYTMCASE